MTGRERMLLAMRNGQPDRVPCAPDMSNMIPCRLTGKPFWDIYLYQDPPLWQAYMDAVEYFGIDGWVYNLDGFSLPDPEAPPAPTDITHETVIIEQTHERIVTRAYTQRDGGVKEWSKLVTAYPRYDPPTTLLAEKVGLAADPERYWPIEGVKPQKQGFDLLADALARFQQRGVIGCYVGPPQLGNPDQGWGYSIYDYCDKYDEVKAWSERGTQASIDYLRRILAGPVRPDFILTGGSGMLVFNTLEIIRDLALPALQAITRICKEADIPSQIHCCGPERALVKLCAEETDLTSINPLEIPPMGDCALAEMKRLYGHRLSLMGNLHTTDVMLRGTADEVRRAARQAIDDAGAGGGFILSTGDQCGRDTPDENIFALVEVAKTYGKY